MFILVCEYTLPKNTTPLISGLPQGDLFQCPTEPNQIPVGMGEKFSGIPVPWGQKNTGYTSLTDQFNITPKGP